MRRPPRYLWFALAGLALSWPAPVARAECGRYVLIGSPSRDRNGRVGTMAGEPATTTSPARHPTPTPSSPGPKPCPGPGCSQGGGPTFPSPVTPTSTAEEDWLHHAPGTPSAGPPTDFLSALLTAARPVRIASPVYHPPR